MATRNIKSEKTKQLQGAHTSSAVVKLMQIEKQVSLGLVGRESMIRDLSLAFVARTNVLFLGPPGTAKTMGVQRFAALVMPKGKTFDVLLTKFTTRDEVFGPVDLQELKGGTLRYNTTGFLPEAEFGILDEVFKGSSAIQNAMLRIANERTFRNGDTETKCPTRMLVGMSNEFPEDPALLAAFFDRFPIKRMVGYLEADAFRTMLAAKTKRGRDARAAELNIDTKAEPVVLTDEDRDEIDRLFKATRIPDVVLDALAELREKLKAKQVIISDRRWMQAIDVLRAAAVLAQRDEVTKGDLRVLEGVLWNNEAQLAAVQGILPDFVSPFEKDLRRVLDEVYAERKALIEQGTPQAIMESASTTLRKIRSIGGQIDMLDEDGLSESEAEKLAEVKTMVERLDKVVMNVARGRATADDLTATMADDVVV